MVKKIVAMLKTDTFEILRQCDFARELSTNGIVFGQAE